MNEKITLQGLVARMAASVNMTKRQAEDFIREFTSLIIQGLDADGIVKIKALGTFKLIKVEDRKSVDVNTGEDINISGHRKITFTPSNDMASRVNWAFEDFEAVELNEDLPTDDDPIYVAPSEDSIEDENLNYSAENEVIEDVVVSETVIEIEKPEVNAGGSLAEGLSLDSETVNDFEIVPEDEIVSEDVIVAEGEEPMPEEPAAISEEEPAAISEDEPVIVEEQISDEDVPNVEPLDSDIAAEDTNEEVISANEEVISPNEDTEGANDQVISEEAKDNKLACLSGEVRRRRRDDDWDESEYRYHRSQRHGHHHSGHRFLWGFLSGFIAAIAVVAIAVLVSMYVVPALMDSNKKADTIEETENYGIVIVEERDSIMETGNVQTEDSDRQEVDNADNNKDSVAEESKVSTKPSDAPVYDTITKTRYLTTMAKEHYGNYNLWPYIYEENKAKLGHPDRIRPGTQVVVPPLSKYGVDADNPEDIRKAKRLGVEIYNRYNGM